MEFKIGRKFLIVKTHATYQSKMLKTCGSPLWIPKGAFYLCPLQPSFIRNFCIVFKLRNAGLDNLINHCIQRDRRYAKIMRECEHYRENEHLPTPIDNFPVFAEGMRHAQKVTLYASFQIPRFGSFLDMGIGKSKVAIDNIALRFAYKQAKTVLVVCPKLNVFNTWLPEFEKHSKVNVPVLPIVGGKGDKTDLLFNENREFYVHVMTYDTLWRYIDKLPLYDIVIFDESRALGNAKSNRSDAAFQVSVNAKYVMEATGTPNTLKNMKDVFSQYKVMTLGQTFGLRYQDFLEEYFVDVGKHFPLWVLKKGSFDIIQQLMFTVAISYKKEDCMDLPPRTIKHEYILPTKFQRYFMDCFDEGFSLVHPNLKIKKFFEENGINYDKEVKAINDALPISKVTKLQEITSGFYKPFTDKKKKIIATFPSTKVNATLEILDTIPNEKVIIWCRFSEDVENLQTVLKKKKIKSFLMTGQKDEIKKWQKSKTVNVLIAMEQVGKGMTLIETAYMIYYSYNYSLEHFLQSLDRNYRHGQLRHVYVFILLVKDTVDQAVIKILDTNQRFSKKLTAKRFKKLIRGK
jgi:SNF2 family DNA or RNA helicase